MICSSMRNNSDCGEETEVFRSMVVVVINRAS